MRKKPKLTNIHTVAQSRIFNLESMDVEFSNGATRVYERLMSRGNGAVLVIPMLDDDTVLMIYEFSGGTAVSYTHLRAHETDSYLVCRLLLEKRIFVIIV